MIQRLKYAMCYLVNVKSFNSCCAHANVYQQAKSYFERIFIVLELLTMQRGRRQYAGPIQS